MPILDEVFKITGILSHFAMVIIAIMSLKELREPFFCWIGMKFFLKCKNIRTSSDGDLYKCGEGVHLKGDKFYLLFSLENPCFVEQIFSTAYNEKKDNFLISSEKGKEMGIKIVQNETKEFKMLISRDGKEKFLNSKKIFLKNKYGHKFKILSKEELKSLQKKVKEYFDIIPTSYRK